MSRRADRDILRLQKRINGSPLKRQNMRLNSLNFFEEVLAGDTKANFKARVETEYGACKGKQELATKTKQLNLDGIYDTVHEMCKDDAPHGQALSGISNNRGLNPRALKSQT